MGRKQSDPGSTRRTETTGKTSTTCNAIRDDLHDYFVGLRKPSGPVSKFFDRQFTCAVVLLLIYSARHVLRRLQIWYYYDDPPPPDMGFPGWEGPVFVAQLFGISDTAAALFTVDCRAWMIVGILWMLAGPFAFLCYSNYRVYSLIHYSETLRFNKSSTHRIPEMFDKLRHLPGGCLAKSAQCFIFAMDIRFQGGWIKSDKSSTFWAWTMANYTDSFSLFLSWTMAKKIIVAMNKNLLGGFMNALVMIAVYGIDLFIFVVPRPLRDNTAGFSQAISALTNLVSIFVVAFPFLEHHNVLPDWMDTVFVIAVSTAGTMVMAITGLMSPLIVGSQVIAKLVGVSVSTGGGQGGQILSETFKQLMSRFDKIFLARTKAAAARHVQNVKARAEVNGRAGVDADFLGEARLISHKSMSLLKKHSLHPAYVKRYMVLREGVLKWYKVENMIVDEFEQYDIEPSPQDCELRMVQGAVKKCDFTKDSQFHMTYGECFGLIIEPGITDSEVQPIKKASQRVMFTTEELRDIWFEKLSKIVEATKIAHDVESGSTSLPLQPHVRFCLVVQGNMDDISGVEQHFIDILSNDIAKALEGRQDRLRDMTMKPGPFAGTLAVDMSIPADFCTKDPSLTPLMLFHHLQWQLRTPGSPLMQGRCSRLAIDLKIKDAVAQDGLLTNLVSESGPPSYLNRPAPYSSYEDNVATRMPYLQSSTGYYNPTFQYFFVDERL